MNYAKFYQNRITQLLKMREHTEAKYNALFNWLNDDLFPQQAHPDNELDPDIEMNTGECLLMEALDEWDSNEDGNDDEE